MGKKIAVTGGIGSGKSVVSRILSLMGIPVYDCDSRAKALMESDTYNGNKWTLSDRSVLLVNLSNNGEHAVQISYISAKVNKE